jgi:glycosyltransferase involved in cell wall biosynthesis
LAYLPRPDIEMRWYHRIPGLLGAYRGFCQRLSRGSNAGLRRNLSLANSAFVAGKIKDVHGVESRVLYPPVPGDFPDIPWERRRAAAVAVGRMHCCKRWEMAVEIVDLVRREGLDLSLTLIAHRDDPEYGQRMAALAASRPWFRILSDLSREQLAWEVAQHRYGLHTMENEHFGIAVAELLRAGCIPFVHDSGGPVEIVGGRAELRFPDATAGARAVASAMRDPARQEGLRQFLAGRRNLFSAEEFCDSLRRLAGEFGD